MRRFLLLVAFGYYFICASSVSAATLNLHSGNAPQGQTDPLITVRGAACTINGISVDAAPVASQQATVVQSPNSSWGDPPTGSRWIGVASGSANSTPAGGYLFESSFDLPAFYSSPSMRISLLADNRYAVYLNGYFIDESRRGEYAYWSPPGVYTPSDPSCFRQGTNALQIYVMNDYNPDLNGPSPMGLAFSAQVSYVPEPSSLIALLTGVGGLGGLMWKRRR
jgi:hypothetical protein